MSPALAELEFASDPPGGPAESAASLPGTSADVSSADASPEVAVAASLSVPAPPQPQTLPGPTSPVPVGEIPAHPGRRSSPNPNSTPPVRHPAAGPDSHPDGLSCAEVWGQRWLRLGLAVADCQQSRWENSRPLHQLRVAVRRVSVATRVWQDRFEPGLLDPLERDLRRLRRCSGRARDLDVRRVYLERLLSDCDPRHLAVVDLLYEQATLERESLQPRLLAELFRFTRQHPEVPRLDCPAGEVGGDSSAAISHLATDLLGVLAGLPSASEDLPPDLHELRLSLKRLRYRVELLADLHAAPVLSDSLTLLRALQGSLGDLHDAEVARSELKVQRRHWNRQRRQRRRWANSPAGLFTWRELRSGVKYLRQQYRRQRNAGQKAFATDWNLAIGPEGLPRLTHWLRSVLNSSTTGLSIDGGAFPAPPVGDGDSIPRPTPPPPVHSRLES